MYVPFVDLKAQYGTLRTDVVKAMWDVLEAVDLSPGTQVRAFEAEFAAYCRVRHAVGVGSGTDALYLALLACGIRPGDEVITAANSFISTTEAILRLGAVPVYVDVEPASQTLDPRCLDAAIGNHTRAIVPVHLYGHAADMDPIQKIASHYGLVVVEDARHAPGAEYHGRRVGGMGDAGAFSFSVEKNLGAYGDAGAVTTNSRAISEEIRRLRNHGLALCGEPPNASVTYDPHEIGISSALDELHAAVLRIKLRRLDSWNARRRAHAQTYLRLLQELPIVPPTERDGDGPVYHFYVIRAPERDRTCRTLRDRGVGVGIHNASPVYRRLAATRKARVAGDLTVTEELATQVLSLPMYPELEPEQLAYVADCLREAIGVGQTTATPRISGRTR